MKIIESITIRYFRSVYTVTLSPCKDLTVITGKNDVGKSNIIKALNLFFNQESDYLQAFDFAEDYSLLRKEEVKKDTIRGQQFISITIRFCRGNRMTQSLPPFFSVTRRWDAHSKEYKQTTDVYARMQQYAKKNNIKYSEKTTSMFLSIFLNKISFIYIPAIKDEKVFNGTVNWLQESLFTQKNKAVLDAPIAEANQAVQKIVSVLQDDFKNSTGIENSVELPNTLNYTKGLLQIITNTRGGSVAINKRGDGIRSHYIPKILNYVAQNSNRLYIWGFEEPENSYEYRRCIQVADEFDKQYSKNSQVFITSHSPAFFNNPSEEKKIVVNMGYRDNKTVILDDVEHLDEELGYRRLYQGFIDQVKGLEAENAQKAKDIETLREALTRTTVPTILTEGKTDAALLKLAIQKLGLTEYSQWNIKPVTCEKTSNWEALRKFLCELRDNSPPAYPIIGMFDRDVKIEMFEDGECVDIRTCDYFKVADRIYCFAIPVPHNRPESEQISIEHYFSNAEIKTEKDGKRLFLGNEFYKTGVYKGDEDLYYKSAHNVYNTIKVIEYETRSFVTKVDGEGDYSLSKTAFVQSIIDNEVGFSEISFEEFRKIFEIVDRIALDYSGSI